VLLPENVNDLGQGTFWKLFLAVGSGSLFSFGEGGDAYEEDPACCRRSCFGVRSRVLCAAPPQEALWITLLKRHCEKRLAAADRKDQGLPQLFI